MCPFHFIDPAIRRLGNHPPKTVALCRVEKFKPGNKAEKKIQDKITADKLKIHQAVLHELDVPDLSKLGKIVIDEDVDFYDPNKVDLVKQVTIKKPVIYSNNNKNPIIKNKFSS